MNDINYLKEVHGVKMAVFDVIVAKQIGYGSSFGQTNASCLQNELVELKNDATELRANIQQQLDTCSGDVDTPTISCLRAKLAKAESDMRQYECFLESATKIIEAAESEMAKGQACGFELLRTAINKAQPPTLFKGKKRGVSHRDSGSTRP